MARKKSWPATPPCPHVETLSGRIQLMALQKVGPKLTGQPNSPKLQDFNSGDEIPLTSSVPMRCPGLPSQPKKLASIYHKNVAKDAKKGLP